MSSLKIYSKGIIKLDTIQTSVVTNISKIFVI